MNRTLTLLAAANFAVGTAGMLVAGVLNLMAASFGLTLADAGHLITAYALGFAIGSPLLTASTGTVCRKRVLLVGIAIVCIGNVAGAIAPSYSWLVVSRVVAALGAGLVVPAVSAIAAYLGGESGRAQAISAVLLGLTAATIIGVPLGTLLGIFSGWRAALVVVGILAVSVGTLIWFLLPGNIRLAPIPLHAWRLILGDWRAHLFLSVTLLLFTAQFVVFAYIAPFLTDVVGLESKFIPALLLWFGVASLAANRVVAWFVKPNGIETFMLLAVIGMTLSIAGLHWSDQRLYIAVICTGIWGVLGYAFVPLQQARLVGIAPQAAGALLSLNASAMFAGQALGSLVGSVTIARGTLGDLPWAAAAVGGVATIAFVGSWFVAKPRSSSLNIHGR